MSATKKIHIANCKHCSKPPYMDALQQWNNTYTYVFRCPVSKCPGSKPQKGADPMSSLDVWNQENIH